MKLLWIPFTLLLSVSTLMLLYHWDRAEAGSQDGNIHSNLGVSMTVKENKLQFGYTYEHLKAGIYTLETPEKATAMVCSQQGGTCRITNQETPEMILEKEGEVLVGYTIPMPENEVINDWMLVLKKEGRVMQLPFSLTIQDFDAMKNPWLVPAEKKSDIQMENLRYYKFSSLDESLPLTRKDGISSWEEEDSLVTYKTGTELSDEVKQELRNFLALTDSVLIQLDQPSTKVSEKLMEVEGRDVMGMRVEYVLEHLRKVTAEENPWEIKILKDVFTKKKTKMAKEIDASLSDEELEEWEIRLLQAENIDDLGVFLDEELSGVFGTDISYFQNYKAPTKDKLHYAEAQRVFKDDQLVTDHFIHYHGSAYLSLTDISRRMGFELTEIEQRSVYRVEVPGKEYVFYVDQPTFVVNKESFGMGEDLLIMVEDTPYIKGQDLQELFDMNLTTRWK
ncbi:hypothetical protein J0K78_00550 [Halobacillus sp. GSS1]|uniref:hypothetical protein n=1 Tax=Halobacillus sp. GSS1 TaxID=2815919 RepID=UPI001A8D592F|nr:hypothetical protein [Halobacillus sp. GSS1]MBN9652733.1 hypothetical protein [Halobacillus sp. GSS1]